MPPGPGGPGRAEPVSRLLIEEIERPRSGPMRDIVATIQPDQDDIVRADAGQTVCVQGAPGTGKTVPGAGHTKGADGPVRGTVPRRRQRGTLSTMASIPINADLYLRLSDFRADDADSFPAREKALRTRAAELGWTVANVVVENDVAQDGRRKPASAYKRQRVIGADGRPVMAFGRPVFRVLRPGWQQVLTDLGTGAVTAVLAEDLDRVARDPRDVEDLIDAIAACGGHARSLSGSLTLTDGGTNDQVSMARVMVVMAAKASADTARRVADGRQRSAEVGSYGGGRRPFGFRIDPDAPKGAKKLVMVPAEAAVVRRAAAAILAETADDRKSLAFLARELRDGDVPTVTGKAWSAEVLRDIMLSASVAGIASNSRTGTETAGAWPAILDMETWQAVRAILTDPARLTNPSANAPRWLGTNLYRCGVCPDGGHIKAHGGVAKGPSYCCKNCQHVRRTAVATDTYVGELIAERLSRADAIDLLRPPDRPGVDTAVLRAEQKKLERAGARQARMHALGEITDKELRAGSRARQERLEEIAGQLAATTAPDHLAEFRGAASLEDTRAVWARLSLARQRDVLSVLAVVTLLPARRGGRGFDENSIRIEWLA